MSAASTRRAARVVLFRVQGEISSATKAGSNRGSRWYGRRVLAGLEIVDGRRPNSEHRLRARIAELRDQMRYLADEIWAWESRLPYQPDRICPCCDRDMPGQRSEA